MQKLVYTLIIEKRKIIMLKDYTGINLIDVEKIIEIAKKFDIEISDPENKQKAVEELFDGIFGADGDIKVFKSKFYNKKTKTEYFKVNNKTVKKILKKSGVLENEFCAEISDYPLELSDINTRIDIEMLRLKWLRRFRTQKLKNRYALKMIELFCE